MGLQGWVGASSGGTAVVTSAGKGKGFKELNIF